MQYMPAPHQRCHFRAPSSAYMPCHTVNSPALPHLHIILPKDTLTGIVRLLQQADWLGLADGHQARLQHKLYPISYVGSRCQYILLTDDLSLPYHLES